MNTFTALVTAIRPSSNSDRRLRAVAAAPAMATSDDVEMLIRAHGVAETKVWAVCDYLALTEVAPTQVWNWVMEFDGSELANLIASDLTGDEVVAALENFSTLQYDVNVAA